MKTLPILFSTPMIQAIMDGRKTQTRRIVKPQPCNFNDKSFVDRCNFKNGDWCLKHQIESNPDRFEITDSFKSKYQIGDILWARETWVQWDSENDPLNYAYKADGYFQRYGAWERDTPDGIERIERWKPSIFMPRAAARIFLKVKNVRVERLQDISEEDAKAEGAYDNNFGINGITSYKSGFEDIWFKINGPESWKENPFVWVYEFERIEKPKNFLS